MTDGTDEDLKSLKHVLLLSLSIKTLITFMIALSVVFSKFKANRYPILNKIYLHKLARCEYQREY